MACNVSLGRPRKQRQIYGYMGSRGNVQTVSDERIVLLQQNIVDLLRLLPIGPNINIIINVLNAKIEEIKMRIEIFTLAANNT